MTNRVFKNVFALAMVSVLLFACTAMAQEKLTPVPENLKTGFDSIKGIDAFNYVYFLASDELEGRDTASRGMRIARNYVASLFANWGLQPAGDKSGLGRSFHQYIDMAESMEGGEFWAAVTSSTGGAKFVNGVDYRSGRGSASGEITASVVFAGYGISAPDKGYDDFAGIDVKGKLVAVLNGLPGDGKKGTIFEGADGRGKYGFMYRYRELPVILKEKGALGLITINIGDSDMNMRRMFGRGGVQKAEEPFQMKPNGEYVQGTRIESPNRRISIPSLERGDSILNLTAFEKMADALFASTGKTAAEIKAQIDKTIKPASRVLDCKVTIHSETKSKKITSGNVLGMIEGSDPKLKNEVIVIGAHLDHLGVNKDGYVFNGADDNASGSAGVLELAQAFALNPEKPKRTVIFACWTGEEKGLLGSRYFVANPTLKDKKIVANINMDMISRDFDMDSMDRYKSRLPKDIEINAKTISIMTGASSSAQAPWFKTTIEKMNKEYVGMILLTSESTQLSGGSDHAPFHAEKIPAVGFMAAFHKEYHQPGDSIEKINPLKMEMTLKVIYMTVFNIGNQETPLTWTEK